MDVMWFAIIGIACGASSQESPEPSGAAVTLSQAGLDYATDIFRRVATKKIIGMALPGRSGSNYKAYGLKIEGFNIPKVTAKFDAPDQVELSVERVGGLIRGHYHAWVMEPFSSVFCHWPIPCSPAKISKYGGVKVHLGGVSMTVKGKIEESRGRPGIEFEGCEAGVSSVLTKLEGNLIDGFINLADNFGRGITDLYGHDPKSFLSDPIKGALPNKLCEEVKSAMQGSGNEFLAKIPMRINLKDKFFIDYSLTRQPGINGSSVSFFSRAVFGHGEKLSKIAASTHQLIPQLPADEQMLCITFDPAQVAGSAADAATQADLMKLNIDTELLSSFKADSSLLKCRCADLCIGKTVLLDSAKCPAEGSVVMTAKESRAPEIKVNSKGGEVVFYGSLEIYGPGRSELLVQFDVELIASVKSALSFENGKLSGDIQIEDSTFTAKTVNIPELKGKTEALEEVQDGLSLIMDEIIGEELTNMAKAGFQIPDIPDVTLLNPDIKFGDGAVSVCGSVEYTGSI